MNKFYSYLRADGAYCYSRWAGWAVIALFVLIAVAGVILVREG